MGRKHLVVLGSFLYNCASGIMQIVSIPRIAKEVMEVPELMLGMYAFIPSLLYIPAAILGGRLSERYGRRAVLLFAVVVSMFAAALLAVLQTPWMFLLPSILVGIGGGVYWPVIEAALSDGQSTRQIKHGVGVFNLCWMSGLFVGPVVGSALHDGAPLWPLVLSLLILGAILLLLALPGTMRIVPWKGGAGAFAHESGISARKRALFVNLGLGANLTLYFMMGCYRSLLAEYTKDVDIKGWRYGVLTGILMFGMAVASWFLRRWHGWHYSFRWLFGAQAAVIALLLVYVSTDQYWLLVALAFALGVPCGLAYYSSIYYGLEQRESKGAHGGNHEAFVGLGLALGPLFGSWAIRLSGAPRANLVLCAFVVAGSLCVQAWLSRRRLFGWK